MFETEIQQWYYQYILLNKGSIVPERIITNTCRSPLKWAGGKYRLLTHLHKHLPTGKRLIEPFAGAGSLFLNTNYQNYLLNDINPDLILFFQTVQQLGDDFTQYAKKFFNPRYNNETQFYKLRQKFNVADANTERAALFLYLNRHAYNGLCRYNKKGYFNAPFGRYVKPYFPEKELQHLHQKSQSATFICKPFEDVMSMAKKSDVVYCDPPYVPLSKTAHFTQYSGHYFCEQQQQQLAKLAETLTAKKIAVIISNHNTKFTRDIYAPAKLIKFKVRRFISCNGKKRNHANELIAIY